MGEWEVVFLGGPLNFTKRQFSDPQPVMEADHPDRPGWVHVYCCVDRDDGRRRLMYAHKGEARVEDLPWHTPGEA